MKESVWGYWLFLMGVTIIMVMILLHNYTTTNQQDYYLIREITYASMYDSLDYGYYKKHGEVKIIKEKFLEIFIRRFAESATLNKSYKINFYKIYETPPAVSLEIRTTAGDVAIGKQSEDLDVTTRITAILELK